jgi:hypothetical protein
MSIHSKEALNQNNITIIADRGYFKSEEIKESYDAGFRPLVPAAYTSNNVAPGRFGKTEFIFIASDNEYLCPAENRLRRTVSTTYVSKKQVSYRAKSTKSAKAATLRPSERLAKSVELDAGSMSMYLIICRQG